jgi:hypothetical protein
MTAWELCTEQDVRDIQTIPVTIPETWSEMVEGMIRQHTGLNKLAITEATYTDTKSGDNSTFMRLKNSPITSVTSVTIDGVSVSLSDVYVGEYFIQLETGVFTYGTRNVVIVYTAGGGTVTPDIRMAAAEMIVAIANYYGRAGADQSIKWATMQDGNATKRGGEDSSTTQLGLPSHLRGIMRATIANNRIKIG